MRVLDSLALLAALFGGFNFGLMGAFQYNLIAAIFGDSSTLATRIIYGVIGLSALWSLRFLAMSCMPHEPYLDDEPYTTERTPTDTSATR